MYLWLGQRPDQVELLPLLAGVDGGPLVVVHQLVQVLEFPLADTVEAILDVDPEVLVAAGSFQGHAEVTNLQRGKEIESPRLITIILFCFMYFVPSLNPQQCCD